MIRRHFFVCVREGVTDVRDAMVDGGGVMKNVEHNFVSTRAVVKVHVAAAAAWSSWSRTEYEPQLRFRSWRKISPWLGSNLAPADETMHCTFSNIASLVVCHQWRVHHMRGRLYALLSD
jgi:hypothetical protein